MCVEQRTEENGEDKRGQLVLKLNSVSHCFLFLGEKGSNVPVFSRILLLCILCSLGYHEFIIVFNFSYLF